jgi:flagellar assembly factor FliW
MTTMTMEKAPTQGRALRFVEPLPGFDDEDAYTLAAIDDQGLLYALRSVRDPKLRFVLTPPAAFFEDYRPELPPVIINSLRSDSADDVEVLVMLTVPSSLVDATANLRAPIVVSTTTGLAMQVVLDDETLPMQRRLVGQG